MRTAITIILNGGTHLQEQAKIIPRLFDKWIIVEGASKSTHCTGWCREMPEGFATLKGNSVDGTTELLKDIQSTNKNVDLYLANGMWDGKISMFNHGLTHSNPDDGFLWQIDIDEYWEENQIQNAETLVNNMGADCALFLCDYLLSPNIIVRGTWGEGQEGNYKRLWKYKKGLLFVSHEPPKLQNESACVHWKFTPRFKHLAYYYESDVIFKSRWYADHENVYEGRKNVVSEKVKLPCSVEELFLKPVQPAWKNTCITYK
jgi:hypothetical protein